MNQESLAGVNSAYLYFTPWVEDSWHLDIQQIRYSKYYMHDVKWDRALIIQYLAVSNNELWIWSCIYIYIIYNSAFFSNTAVTLNFFELIVLNSKLSFTQTCGMHGSHFNTYL